MAFVLTFLSLLAAVSWVFGVMMAVAQDLPRLESQEEYRKAENSLVFDRHGNKLTTLTSDEARIFVESEDVSPFVKQAVVAIEDRRFYEHSGVDYLGIARALREDIFAGGAVQGGSTITQQFVKNALEAQGSRTILQKLRESALAYNIERKWSKDRILTNYLNNIYFGEGAYGIEVAARTYFGSAHPGCGSENADPCARVLRPEEGALLAAMISSPSRFSPIQNPIDATAQRDLVLDKMVEEGTLTPEQATEAKEASIPAASAIEPPKDQGESEVPYFTSWLRQQVVDKYGAGEAFGGGLEIHTTLDLDLQRAAEQAVSSRLSGLGPSAAAVVIDNKTGGVLAMVGGLDFESSAFNLATNGRRQPGSAFKPFTLVTALEDGRTAADRFVSEPKEIPFDPKGKPKRELFRVNNYEDKYLGSTSLASATTFSDNSVYAELGMSLGTRQIAKTAERMGVESFIPRNPAMILGGMPKGVTPLEMTYAYTTLANGGTRVSGTLGANGNGSGPVAIERVVRDGDSVKDDLGASGENETVTDEALPQPVAEGAVGLLRSVVTSGTGRRAATTDYTWGKTGTTDSNVDAWFCGGVDGATACVWVGYPDGNTSMNTEFGGQPVDGGTIPALIWQEIMGTYVSQRDARQAEREAEKAAEEAAESAEEAPVPVEPAPEPVPAPEPAPEPAPAEGKPNPNDEGVAPKPGGGGAEDEGSVAP